MSEELQQKFLDKLCDAAHNISSNQGHEGKTS